MKKFIYLSFIFLFIPQLLFAAPAGKKGIEEITVQPPGGMQFSFGISYEKERELTKATGKYNNWRISPFEFKYGLSKRFELGVNLDYSSNSSVNNSGLDEQGIEGINLSGKYKWNSSFAISGGVKFSGENNVYPYGNDGSDVWVNFPIKVPSGPGYMIYEIGYTSKTGESQAAEFNGYFNLGAGYHFVVSPNLTLRSEILGHDETVNKGESFSGLILGMDWKPGRTNVYRPRFTFGVDDGKPDYSFGFEWIYKFGDRGPKPTLVKEKFSRSSWFKKQSGDTEADETVIVPQQENEDNVAPPGKPKSAQTTKKALGLAESGLQAYRNNKLSVAVQKMKKALRYAPDNTEIIANLATIYYYQQKYKKARTHYRRVVELTPRDVTARIGLGAVYYKMEKFDSARKQIEKALEVAPDNERAKKWLKRLEDK